MLASIAFVAVAVLQRLFFLGGLIGLGLGGSTGAQQVLFFGGAGVALVALLTGLVLVRNRRLPPRAGWAAFCVPAVDAILVAVLVGGVGAGSCSEGERRLLRDFARAGVEQTFGYADGSCSGSFQVPGGGADVMDRYRAQLLAQGWTITVDSSQPGMGEGGSPMPSGELDAARGAAHFSRVFEEYGGSAHVVVRVTGL